MAERRKSVRAVVRLEVEGGKRNLLRVPLYVTENLSRGGMFLITKDPLKEGTELNLEFSLPKDEKTIKVTAKVIWAREADEKENLAPGMGILFTKISDEDRGHISNFVEEMAGQS
jgi:uncharacterized protein (TIGR02266 family)